MKLPLRPALFLLWLLVFLPQMQASYTIRGTLAGAGNGGTNAIAEQTRQVFVPPANENLGDDLSGNRNQNARWAHAWNSLDQLTASDETSAPPNTAQTHLGYTNDLLGRRIEKRVTLASTLPDESNAPALTQGGGPVTFAGQLSKPATVTVAGQPATVDGRNRYSAQVSVSPGPQTVPIVATDPATNTSVTHSYQVNVSAGSPRSYSQDANGNITASTSGDGSGAPNATYEWDAADRLVAINTGTHRTEIEYDGLGQRVHWTEKDSGTVTSEKRFLWCGGEMCEERDAGGANVTKRYFAQGEQRLGGSDAGIYFYARDHRGSVREMTDWNGTVRAEYDYSPWGQRSKLGGDLDCDFGFTGFYLHSSSGLNFSDTRAYDCVDGKWLSRDPIAEAGGINLYGYVGNDPVNRVDPTGLFWLPIPQLLAGLIVYQTAHTIFEDHANEIDHITFNCEGEAPGQRLSPQMVDMLMLIAGLAYSLDGGPNGLALGAAGGLRAVGGCFVKGTLVATPAGEKKIEDIKKGDTVWAYDFQTKKVVGRKVLETVKNFTYHWVHILVGGEMIQATRGHLFWVESKQQWIEAAFLKRGMTVRLQGGRTAEVKSAAICELQKPKTTYNLIVETEHNYFVGKHFVLVHNGFPDPADVPPASGQFDKDHRYSQTRFPDLRNDKSLQTPLDSTMNRGWRQEQQSELIAEEKAMAEAGMSVEDIDKATAGEWRNLANSVDAYPSGDLTTGKYSGVAEGRPCD